MEAQGLADPRARRIPRFLLTLTAFLLVAGAGAGAAGMFLLGLVSDVRWLVPISYTAFAGAGLGWYANRAEEERRHTILDIARISLGLALVGLAASALACTVAALVNPLLFMVAIGVCGLCGVPSLLLALAGLGLMLVA